MLWIRGQATNCDHVLKSTSRRKDHGQSLPKTATTEYERERKRKQREKEKGRKMSREVGRRQFQSVQCHLKRNCFLLMTWYCPYILRVHAYLFSPDWQYFSIPLCCSFLLVKLVYFWTSGLIFLLYATACLLILIATYTTNFFVAAEILFKITFIICKLTFNLKEIRFRRKILLILFCVFSGPMV